jgi:hypothetical protein
MAVTNSEVRRIAQMAVDSFKHEKETSLGSPLATRTTIRLAKALGQVITTRQGFHDDDNMAAADHYLNMRLLTSVNYEFYPMGWTLTEGYDLVKVTLQYLPDQVKEILKESKHPLTPPTPEIRAWALRGLGDGLGDWPGMLRRGTIQIPSRP